MFGRKKSSHDEETHNPEEPRMAPTPRSSRPDASAVLDRQPVPPVSRPVAQSPGGPAQARRAPEQSPTAAASQEKSMEKTEGEGKKLIVGKGIRLSGEIQACEKLVVEGEVHADLTGALVLEIAESGLFKGRATVDYAEISGSFDGELTVRDRLLLRGTGQIDGDLRYAEIEVERGGRIRGTIGEQDDSVGKAKPQANKAEKASNGGGNGRSAPAAKEEEAAIS
ncbi:bactofilin family protein [Aquibaculum arenosum]|uniref:Polymer-forming cytoskeletal protein n=1 Tax=Aquibaculum arenosum TaxID=3032591 RepID=A0ABT5YNP9_9PROT|nr:polymer-forming cytoskeletal protein [Fodinicurvata sp. CAU 1616]MDF2096509.1 polymer-forming cytoskeletal protein [Fodinicurvata sp. CAU 1616]